MKTEVKAITRLAGIKVKKRKERVMVYKETCTQANRRSVRVKS